MSEFICNKIWLGRGRIMTQCACGCGEWMPSCDKAWRPRRFVNGHLGRSPEMREYLSKKNTGRKHTAEEIQKIIDAQTGRPNPHRGHPTSEYTRVLLSKQKIGERNPSWKGDAVSIKSLHEWLRNHLPRPDLCQVCNIKPSFDVANISPSINPETYTRDFENWRWICRSCHIKHDRAGVTGFSLDN